MTGFFNFEVIMAEIPPPTEADLSRDLAKLYHDGVSYHHRPAPNAELEPSQNQVIRRCHAAESEVATLRDRLAAVEGAVVEAERVCTTCWDRFGESHFPDPDAPDAWTCYRCRLREAVAARAAALAERDEARRNYEAVEQFLRENPNALGTKLRAALNRVAELESARRPLAERLAALELVHQEARELIGQYDGEGRIDRANLEALRALLWRADVRRRRPGP